MEAGPRQTVERFVKAINDIDNDACYALMAEDFRFIDSMGGVYDGRKKTFWPEYWAIVPDYRIVVSDVFVSGNTVILLGEAGGTYTPVPGGEVLPENYWTTPAAWRAVVVSGRIREWQVYADNEPIRALMRKHEAGT